MGWTGGTTANRKIFVGAHTLASAAPADQEQSCGTRIICCDTEHLGFCDCVGCDDRVGGVWFVLGESLRGIVTCEEVVVQIASGFFFSQECPRPPAALSKRSSHKLEDEKCIQLLVKAVTEKKP
jgi:hypothetical protein